MSEDLDELEIALAEQEALEKKQAELRQKKTEIDYKKTSIAYDHMKVEEEAMEKVKSFNFGRVNEGQIASLIRESEQYLTAAERKMEFINKTFRDIVPFFRKNLILCGAHTGSGKSTAVANIVRNLIRFKRPDGTNRRVLVLTNEERAEDFYNRITCLIKGWHYTDHDKFTAHQKAEFSKYIEMLGRTQVLNVVDDSYGGIMGNTTTIEGIKAIFDNLLATGEHYDAIVIDYYQNVQYSRISPELDEWKVQAKLCGLLDNYKNVMPCPIVVFAQVDPITETDKKPFKQRICGRKLIMTVCTHAMEMIAEASEKRTKWIVHKSRFVSALGAEFFTGYKDGAIVEYDAAFIEGVKAAKEKYLQQETDKQSGYVMKQKTEKKDAEVPKEADSSGRDPANG